MMTFEEAKEVFINRAFIPTDDGTGRIHDPEKWREACYVISKWLEQEPCSDAISRQAVLALAKEECDTAIIPYKRFIKNVNALLPVTPQQKTGYWKKMVNVYDMMSGTYINIPYSNADKKMCNPPVYECECGCVSNKPTNFCPNCGAKMVESEG